jgi:predicted RNA binding protein YcfA (HicA-like mRNA interferase family)
MSKLPPLPYRKVRKALIRLGFRAVRQVGSHVFFAHPNGRTTTVPNHPGEDIDPALLRKILKDIAVERGRFLDEV